MEKDKNMTLFESAYKALNNAQKEAVDAVEGPVMVVAGPGTGKTQILALRIANILKSTDTPASGILALTFTESGVVSMRNRLKSFIGEDAYKVQIYTFHSYANNVIERFPHLFPDMAGSKALGDLELALLWEDIFRSHSFEHIRTNNDPFFYLSKVKDVVKKAKQEKIAPAEFRSRLVKERDAFYARDDIYSSKGKTKGQLKSVFKSYEGKFDRSLELVVAYEAYEEALKKNNRHDYEDMVLSVVDRAEKSDELLATLREESLYVLVDEHQDTNRSQNKLLELVTGFHAEPNLFVVGDEKQAIYRFQGASMENFHGIKTFAPSVKRIDLTHNYRSKQPILDASYALVSHGGFAETEALTAVAKEAGLKPVLLESATVQDELLSIAGNIKNDIDSGILPHEIAILFRKNRDAVGISHALSVCGIPHVIESARSIFSVPSIGLYLAYARALISGDPESITRALASPWFAIEPEVLFSALRSRVSGRVSILECMDTHESLISVKKLFMDHAKAVSTTPLLAMLETISRESGFLAYAVSHEEVYESYVGLFTFAQSLVGEVSGATLGTLMERLDAMERHRIDIERSFRVKEGSVRLMTAHRAKGLEFESVYIPHLIESEWSGRRDHEHFIVPLYKSDDKDHVIEDERRLLFVAMTRAKQSLTLSFAKERADGKEAVASRFLSEIDEACLTREYPTPSPRVASSMRFVSHEAADTIHALLREHLMRDGLSVTGLNQYRKNPWKYIFSTFLRIPSAKKNHLMFGSAMDKALEKFTLGENKEKKELLRLFNEAIHSQPIESSELSRYASRGEQALSILYDENQYELSLPGEPKRRIKTPFSVGDTEILLTGELDLVRHDEDGLVVIDFKTGEPKSRNDIEGKTATSGGDYYRQLVFYKLLITLSSTDEMKKGVIQFLEPDKNGAVHREAFSIPSEDVEALKVEIGDTVRALLAGEYMEAECDSDECEYCDLVEVYRERYKVENAVL